MRRRDFLSTSLTSGSLLAHAGAAQPSAQAKGAAAPDDQITIERARPDKPHRGKVLATIAPHSDDHSILCGGTVAKLIDEGYTGYLIRTSNDEKDSFDGTLGETVLANESDNREMARELGIKQVFDLNYRNHFMDDISRVELRGRLIFLIRLLKIDTVLTYDPWGHYEENPDHYVTASAVEAAAWMAAGHLDFPEHFAAGLKPHAVRERYYYARGPQLVNRVVDISSTIDRKMQAIAANQTMIGNMVETMRADLARRGKKLPLLEGDPAAARRGYADLRFKQASARRGAPFDLAFAETFHYIGPGAMEEYVERSAVPLDG